MAQRWRPVRRYPETAIRIAASWVLIALVLCSLLWISRVAWALDPSRFLSQYGHTAWRIQDGDFPGTVFPIGQSTDGYLWIGSQTGVLRFDGAHFVPIADLAGKHLPSIFVVSLLGASNGDLWIGSTHGLSRWSNGQLTEYPDVIGGAHDLVEDQDHVIWFVTLSNDGNALCAIDDGRVACHGRDQGLDLPTYCCVVMTTDRKGAFWISTRDAVVRWSKGTPSQTFALQKKIDGGFTSNPFVSIDSTSAVLVGIADPGPGMGLQRLIEQQWKPFNEQGIDGVTLAVQYLFRDSHGALWVGTADHGLYRFLDDRVDHFGSSEGLSSDYVEYIFEDAQGTVWVTTSQGLDRFRDLRVGSFTKREGVNSDEVDSVLVSRDDRVWIGTPFTLDVLDHGQVHSLGTSQGKPGLQVTALLEDRDGRIWVGIDNRLTIYTNGKFTEIFGLDGKPLGYTSALIQDSAQDVWASVRLPSRKLVRLRDQKAVEELADPIVPPVSSLVADVHDGIWLGLVNGDIAHRHAGETQTYSQDNKGNLIRRLLSLDDGSVYGATALGLVVKSNQALDLIGAQQGLPCEAITGLIDDLHQSLWLQMPCGLVNVARSEIDKAIQNPQYVMHVTTLTAFDGVRAGGAPFNTVARSGDGRLWFANGYSLQTLDPNEHTGANLPAVYIEQVVGDHVAHSPTQALRLPALTRDLQIDYTAPELAVPQRVRFRYRLTGRDSDWVDAESRRQAFYTDLSPGDYQFAVAVSEGGGRWSPTPATQTFSIAPTFYQTGWFAVCVVLAVAVALWLIFTWQLGQIKAHMRVRLDAQLTERVRIARELHDTFLQGVQALMLRFQAAMEKIPPTQPARQLMESALDHADRVLIEGRERVTSLRSPYPLAIDLPKALQDAGEELARHTSAAFAVTIEGTVRELHPEVSDEVRAITTEALTNAFHHAHAKRVDLNITYARRTLTLSVVDDGQGFDVRTTDATETIGHWGIRGMHERAIKLQIELRLSSATHAGTAVELSIPASIAYRSTSRWNSRGRPE